MKVTDASLRVGSLKGKALDAAMRLVELHGVERLNLRDLAAVLGTGPASLYYHFKNKDALLAELAAEGFRQLNRAFLKVQADPGDRPALYGCCATRALGALPVDVRRARPHPPGRRTRRGAGGLPDVRPCTGGPG